ncbi:MAG: hypothetical protein ACYDDP_10535 [Acidithiobacillus sp.]
MLLWTGLPASKSVEIGPVTYPLVTISIVLLSFAALLVGFYVLYRYHRKRVHGFSQKPRVLTDEWLAQQARSAVSANNPLFGRLFAGPVKDDHVWVLLRELNHHLIWVCRQSAHFGFWTLDAKGAPQWRTVPLNTNSLKQIFWKEPSARKTLA